MTDDRPEREEDFFEGGGEEETVKSLVLRPVTNVRGICGDRVTGYQIIKGVHN